MRMKAFYKTLLLVLAFLVNIFLSLPSKSFAYNRFSDTLELDFEISPVIDSGATFSGAFVVTKNSIGAKQSLDDSLAFKEIDYNDQHWTLLGTTQSLYKADTNTFPKLVTWYRFNLKVGPDYAGIPIVFNIAGEGALQLFVNGEIKSQLGSFYKDGNKIPTHLFFSACPIYLTFDSAGVYTIAIRAEFPNNPSSYGLGIDFTDGPQGFRSYRLISLFNGLFTLGIGTVFLSLFIVHLLFYIFYRVDIINFYFALFTLSVAMIFYSLYHRFYYVQYENDYWFGIRINLFAYLSAASLLLFTYELFVQKKSKLIHIVNGIGLLLCMYTIVEEDSFSSLSNLAMPVFLVLTLVYTSVMIIRGMIKGMRGSIILGSGVLYFFLYLLGALVFTIQIGNFNISQSYVGIATLLAVFSLPLSISAYLAARFAHTNKELAEQLKNVETLSLEKQNILESQNEILEQQVTVRTKELKEEKKKSDDLLLNILPQEVADELKETGTSKAQHYEEVTVIFTDFVNFTAISEKLGAEQLLFELNEYFTAFDEIMERHQIEKIKTIGDAYLAVSGLPINHGRHAHNALAAALEILHFIHRRKQKIDYGLDIRIGIHTGPLVAGIVGVKKFAYDIWGDTVNTAARMEQSSIPGHINISQKTYELVKDTYYCEARGKIEVKGKGSMDMYFVKESPTINQL
jgi:adenylate cyclase